MAAKYTTRRKTTSQIARDAGTDWYNHPSVEESLRVLNLIWDGAKDIGMTGTREEVAELGTFYADAIRNAPQGPNVNVYALIVEKLRLAYSRRFGKKEGASAPSLAQKEAWYASAQAEARRIDETRWVQAVNAAPVYADPDKEDNRLEELAERADQEVQAQIDAMAMENFNAIAEDFNASQKLREIPEGTFTVVSATDGAETYETVKIETVNNPASGLHGKRIAKFINGPDNENDFQGFAFVTDQGQVNVWSRFARIDSRWVDAVKVIIGSDEELRGEARKAYAIRSGRCSVCGRKLTTPDSLIERGGIGPECFKKGVL